MNMNLIGAVSAMALMSGIASAQSPGTQGNAAQGNTAQQPAATQPSADAQRPPTPGLTSGASDRNLRPGDTAASNQAPGGSGSTGASAPAAQEHSSTAAGAGAGVASVDKLMGKDIVGKDGETLGEVEDVIVGPNGQAQKLVLARGGFLGMGEKQVAIDFDQVRSRPDDDKLHAFNLSRDDVRNMPAFEYDDGMTSLNRNRTGAAGGTTNAPAAIGTPGAPPAPNGTGTTTAR